MWCRSRGCVQNGFKNIEIEDQECYDCEKCSVSFCIPCVQLFLKNRNEEIWIEKIETSSYLHHHWMSLRAGEDFNQEDHTKCVMEYQGSCEGNILEGISHICEFCEYMICEKCFYWNPSQNIFYHASHPHPLVISCGNETVQWSCDLMTIRCTRNNHFWAFEPYYRCDMCDFDMCVGCFSK